MTDREKIYRLAEESSARHRAKIELNGLEITDLCFLHEFLSGAMSGKQEDDLDPSRLNEAVARLKAICERAIEAEEFI